MASSSKSRILDEVVQAHKRGLARGITSICSAHPQVLGIAMRHARRSNALLLIESTCNQVNQYGGYTGMTPAGFMAFLQELAAREGLDVGRLLVGGDHLGPGPWQDEPAGAAMGKACRLVADCVLAGYSKLHLDASMRLGDDPADRPLEAELSARRSAELARAAEQVARQVGGVEDLRYVIGSEVPPPGGIQAGKEQVAITSVESAAETVEATQRTFHRIGLEDAWERVMALVVEAGVEYGEQGVYAYDPRRAADLAGWIETQEGLVFEAHSTDYQTPEALRRMVADHFAILKVGPALTFAFREAVFALEAVEAELLRDVEERSGLRQALEQAMLRNPVHWEKYVTGNETQWRLARLYGLSDRARYYWPDPGVQAALEKLLHNLEGRELPLGLVSQHLPEQAQRVLSGKLQAKPQALIADKVEAVLEVYAAAGAG